jgi:hypothetical protein
MNAKAPDPGFLKVNVAGQNRYIPVYSGDEEETAPQPAPPAAVEPNERWGHLSEMLSEVDKEGL